MQDTVTQSLEWLAGAADALDSVEATLVGTNSYADGPRRDLERAFSTLRSEIESRWALWAECPECGGAMVRLTSGKVLCTWYGQCELAGG